MNKKLSFKLRNRAHLERSAVFGIIIVGALLAFELFNYSTTDFALSDLLGNLKFVGMRWSTVLSVAFCGIDFAGIARIFTPETGKDERVEVWYLFGAWLLAATMNALLTWWGVSIAILGNHTLGNEVIDKSTLLKAVPVFVAFLVWLSRILLIGTFAIAGEGLFHHTTDLSIDTTGHQRLSLHRSASRSASGRHAGRNPAQASTRTTPDRGQDRFKPAVWQSRKTRDSR
jgi:hypothetical protein